MVFHSKGDTVSPLSDQVVNDIPRYLSKDERSVSAIKIAGILGINHMLAYAVKARVEDELETLRPICQKDWKLDHLPTYREMDETWKKLEKQESLA